MNIGKKIKILIEPRKKFSFMQGDASWYNRSLPSGISCPEGHYKQIFWRFYIKDGPPLCEATLEPIDYSDINRLLKSIMKQLCVYKRFKEIRKAACVYGQR